MTKNGTIPAPKAARDMTGFAAHERRILLL